MDRWITEFGLPSLRPPSPAGQPILNLAEPNAVALLAERLVRRLAELVPCVVAFSGGVDSALVAAAALRAERVLAAEGRGAAAGSIAVTALSPAVPVAQRRIASRVARELGIRYQTVTTEELARADYARNDVRRCFFCKQTLYRTLEALAAAEATALGGQVRIVSGTNADDLGDYRPGIEAGKVAGVHTPLADLGIGKAAVRAIAALWGLSVAELPAAPCLASRIAYGVEVTAERLARIEAAEAWLAERGFSPLRVRLHAGELARIEVAEDEIPRLIQPPLLGELRQLFHELGFRAVTVDLAGFRSGSLNQLVALRGPHTVAT